VNSFSSSRLVQQKPWMKVKCNKDVGVISLNLEGKALMQQLLMSFFDHMCMPKVAFLLL
jgi:hypothetical protein